MEEQNKVQATYSTELTSQSKLKEYSDQIGMCVIADRNFTPSKNQIKFIALELQKDFPELPMEIFKKIMLNGIKGKYDVKYQTPINSRTIFTWFRNCFLTKQGKFYENIGGKIFIDGIESPNY